MHVAEYTNVITITYHYTPIALENEYRIVITIRLANFLMEKKIDLEVLVVIVS